MELTIKLVEVPTKVNVPPKIAANDSGNSNLPGLIKRLFLTVLISAATTAVLFINAEEIAVYTIMRKLDCNLEPLKISKDTRRSTLVRSKANDANTNNTKVISPGLTALVRMSWVSTKDVAKQANIATAKMRSGKR